MFIMLPVRAERQLCVEYEKVMSIAVVGDMFLDSEHCYCLARAFETAVARKDADLEPEVATWLKATAEFYRYMGKKRESEETERYIGEDEYEK